MENNGKCPACASEYMVFVQNVLGQRTGNSYKQFVCLDCLTFFNPSKYLESDQQKQDDFDYLFSHRDRHTALLSQLALEILTKNPGVQTYCEVGFGAGLLMKAFKDFGCETYGFEVNERCYNFASEALGLPCELGMFGPDHQNKYDLIASCMVFEHLEEPRELFATMVSKLNSDGAIYLSVPFAHRHDWRYLWTAGTSPGQSPPDIFYDCDVHITHFSVEGMKRMGLGLGARSAEYWVSKDVFDKSPGSYQGILFKF